MDQLPCRMEEVGLSIVDGSHLTLDDIVAVARHRETVTLAPGVWHESLPRRSSRTGSQRERPIYGRSTGVGANRDPRRTRS